MKFITGTEPKEVWTVKELTGQNCLETLVTAEGAVHSIRDMGKVAFISLRSRFGILQTVWLEGEALFPLELVKEGAFLKVTGILKPEERAPGQIELWLKTIKVLSAPQEPLPLPVGKWKLGASLEARLDRRPLSLRNIRERAVFQIQAGIGRGFREFLSGQGFTEIHSPKIGAKGAEGGSNLFRLDYFHRPAVLAQSPQFYKQMMVGVFDRVFEIGPVFRAEKHNTKRHLNEYTSMDLEMGYIDGFEDIMEIETAMLQYILKLLAEEYQEACRILNIQLPNGEKIPAVRFDEAKRLVSERYGRPIRSPYDLEPEEEQLIGRYMKETYGADFVFVTHYPSKKRPFYAMDDPDDAKYTLSFDLLLGGMEITTGGQRIHQYETLVKKMEARGMGPEGMEEYLETFRWGMPPHGGLGIGLERLTAKIAGKGDVREACLFPRDLSRLTP